MNVKPLKSKLYIELLPVTNEAERIGLVGVDVKRHWDHKTRNARVLAVGPWVTDEICVGDTVVVSGTAGKTIDEGGLDGSGSYRFVKQSEVLGVYETISPDYRMDLGGGEGQP